jgi:alpha-glucosidase (family GH31 glycosyl hydrolase)
MKKCLFDEIAQLLRHLHPDTLFDQPYEATPLDLAPFAALPGDLRLGSQGKNAVELVGRGGGLRLEVCAPWLLRLRAAPRPTFRPSITEQLGLLRVPAAPGEWHCAESAGTVVVRTELLEWTLNRDDNNWRIHDREGQQLVDCLSGGPRFSSRPAEYSGDAFVAAFGLQDEQVFGLGGRIARPGRRGGTADMFAMKVGLHSGDYGGFPIPFFLSTKGYGVFLNNPWPHVYFDMGATRPDQWWLHAPGGEFDLFIIAGPTFAQIVSRFTELVGRVPLPQRWWLGFWTSALAFSSTKEMEAVAHRLRLENYPCDALVVDGPWRGGPEFLAKYMQDGEYPTNDLNWHPDFGDGGAMVQRLAELGFKTVLHQNSRSWLPHTMEQGVKDGTLRRQEREVVVRLTYPEGEQFYRDALKARHAERIGAWWLDHGDRVSGEIRPGIPSRNLFGALWARATQAAGAADGIGQQLCLIRGAGIGGQAASLPWPGDTRFGIDFFEEDLWFCLNAGLCGFPITSADLGGFMSAKEPVGHNTAYDTDNLARRLCQGIFFLPNPRMHQSDSAPAKLPWNCPPVIQRLYRAMLEERYRLTPYFYSYAIHAARTGEPILRHLVYHHTADPVAVATHNQCYIGDWMIVAPVLRHGATERDVYLPAGEWIDWWTGRRVTGGATIRVATPLLESCGLPVFVRAGAIIPRQQVAAHLADVLPDPLTLEVFPAGTTRFACHESADITHEFVCAQQPDGLHLRLPNLTPQPRNYVVHIHGSAPPVEVRQDQALLPETHWSVAPGTGILTAHVTVRPGQVAAIMVR